MLRIEWIDTARGIAILLVVISGFLFREKPIRDFLKSRAKRILVPYFLAQILVTLLAIQIFPDAQDRPRDYLLEIIVAKQTPSFNYPVWFLPCFFVAELIFFLTYRNPLVSIFLSAIGILISREIWLPWFFDVTLASQIFLATGFLLRDKTDRIFWRGGGKSIIPIVLLFIFVIVTAEYNRNIDMPYRIYNNQISDLDSACPDLLYARDCGIRSDLDSRLLVEDLFDARDYSIDRSFVFSAVF